jgi:hypothetical protein
MTGQRALAKGFEIAMVSGLLAAYSAAAGGLAGLLDARHVAAAAIAGGIVALVGAIGYFAITAREVRRRFRPLG